MEAVKSYFKNWDIGDISSQVKIGQKLTLKVKVSNFWTSFKKAKRTAPDFKRKSHEMLFSQILHADQTKSFEVRAETLLVNY